MLDLSSPATEFAPNAMPWRVTGAHPVPPPRGSYIPINRLTLLSAATPGLISAVLVLPCADDDAPAARG